jgi:hypothetical protein
MGILAKEAALGKQLLFQQPLFQVVSSLFQVVSY